MSRTSEPSPLDQLAIDLSDALDVRSIQTLLNQEQISSADIVHLIESTPNPARSTLWSSLTIEQMQAILIGLKDELRCDLLAQMSVEAIAHCIEGMDSDDSADMLQLLESSRAEAVLSSLTPLKRGQLESLLAYSQDSAGGLMDQELVTVRANVSVDAVLRYLRRQQQLPDSTDAVFVTNRHDEFVGMLSFKRLLTADADTQVREIMDSDIEAIHADMPSVEVAQLFQRHDWITAPVINEQAKLIGRITVDDVVDVIREHSDQSLMGMAGLDEVSDTFASVLKSSRRRALWLGINLITAFVAAAVMKQFEWAIVEIVALAVLSPVVASMGGIAGSQTLTLVIRALALGQINARNTRWLLFREAGVGVLNGLLWGGVIALITWTWYGDLALACVIALSILINLSTAVIAGVSLPLILRRLQIDPALSGSVILTTITDVVGFISFLGLASWWVL